MQGGIGSVSAHCKASLSHPAPKHLPAIDLLTEAKPCNLAKGPSTHTTTISNQRGGSIHLIEICVKAKANAVILNGNATATEYKRGFASIRSGGRLPHSFPISVNSAVPSQSDELVTGISFHGSSYTPTNPGQAESASIGFTVDLM